MSLIDRTQKLVPGETVIAAGTGQTGVYPLLWWMPYGEFVTMFNKRRVVAVTDRSIAVLAAGRWATTRPKKLLYSIPRSTSVGPFAKRWAHVQIGEERIWISRKAYRVLEAALAAPAPAVSVPVAATTAE